MDDRNFDQRTAQEWVETIEGKGGIVREKDLYPNLVDWVSSVNPRSVLDIGCGQGICSDKIELENCNYVGVDPSSFLIERATMLYSRSHRQFVNGNAYSLPFSDGQFDAAFSVALWHLLENKHTAARELSRILRDDGAFLIATANPDSYSSWIETYESSTTNGTRLEGKMRKNDGSVSLDILYLDTYDEIMTSFRDSCLEVTKVSTFRTVISIEGRKIGV